MKRSIILFYVEVTAVLALAAFAFSGCQPGIRDAGPSGPIFFPPPPDEPRLQFLKSFSGLKGITGERTDWFESFVLGEPSTE